MDIVNFGKPTPVGAIAIITFFCKCTKSIMMVRDGELVTCNICGKNWRINSEIKYTISEVIATNNPLLESIVKQ